MSDFTIKQYDNLLTALLERKFTFQTFSEFLEKPAERVVMLRQDVDDRKEHSLLFASIQHAHGIKGTYYFRAVPQSMDKKIIELIASLGHEIGYHYEDMDFARKQFPAGTVKSGLYDMAWVLFEKHLGQLREISPVTTISMHGSPHSKFDNKALWEKFDFREVGIIGEPYLDINFDEVAYFTDTGRRWNGVDVSIRDKVNSRFNFNFRSTQQLIAHLDELPDKIMFTFHPQRWNNDPWPWTKELVWQNVKNLGKFALLKMRK